MKPYWFHAFKRESVEQVLHVLCEGDEPHPDPTKTTRINEGIIGIHPPCVYAYMGRSCHTFGGRCVVIPTDALTGDVSPFDTGGVLNNIVPIKDLEVAEKQKFVSYFTWPSSELDNLLEQYPTYTNLTAYLDEERPGCDGPGEIWPPPDDLDDTDLGTYRCPIWAQHDHWKAWTWECRQPLHLPLGKRIIRWTCEPSEAAELQAIIEDRLMDSTSDAEQELLESLLVAYVPGGFSTMLSEMKELQREAA